MMELQKHVLSQVYANKEIFKKELIKSKKWLQPNEIQELKHWLQQPKFKTNQPLINSVFS